MCIIVDDFGIAITFIWQMQRIWKIINWCFDCKLSRHCDTDNSVSAFLIRLTLIEFLGREHLSVIYSGYALSEFNFYIYIYPSQSVSDKRSYSLFIINLELSGVFFDTPCCLNPSSTRPVFTQDPILGIVVAADIIGLNISKYWTVVCHQQTQCWLQSYTLFISKFPGLFMIEIHFRWSAYTLQMAVAISWHILIFVLRATYGNGKYMHVCLVFSFLISHC